MQTESKAPAAIMRELSDDMLIESDWLTNAEQDAAARIYRHAARALRELADIVEPYQEMI